MQESGTQGECQQQNETDRGQSSVGDGLAFALRGAGLGAMPTSVQKAMFEGPVLRQIVPAVVLLFPAVMAEPAHQRGGKGLRIERSDPEPFVLRGFRFKLAASIMILRELLLRSYDPYGLRVIDGER